MTLPRTSGVSGNGSHPSDTPYAVLLLPTLRAGRVAQRTLEQKQIIINNLAFRRASYRLARVNQAKELYDVLFTTFRENDFDAFELQPAFGKALASSPQPYTWRRDSQDSDHAAPEWALSLDLISSTGQHRGRFIAYKGYNKGTLHVDVNLLLEEFRVSLADALERVPRTASHQQAVVPMPQIEQSRTVGASSD